MDTETKSQILSIVPQSRQLKEQLVTDSDGYISLPAKALSWRPLWRTVRRKALLVIGIPSIVTVASLLVTTHKPPAVYIGNFQLLVEPITNEAKNAEASKIARAPEPQNLFTLDYATQIEILQSPKLLSEIVNQVQLQYPSFNYLELRQGLRVERLEKSINEKTKIIGVTYYDSNPELVNFVLDKIAEKYLKYSLDERRSHIGEGIKFIDTQSPGLQKRVNDLEGQIQIIQKQYKLINPQTDGEQLFAQNRAITEQKTVIESQYKEQVTLYNSLQKQLNLTPDEAIAISALNEDAIYQELVTKLREVESQIALESTRFKEDSPPIIALVAKRESLKDLLNKESKRVVGKQIIETSSNFQGLALQNSVRRELISKLVDTSNQIKVLGVRYQTLAKSKDAVERETQQFPAVARQYVELQRQLEMATQTLHQLLTQRETLRVEAAQNQLPWELISPPQVNPNNVVNSEDANRQARKTLILLVVLSLVASIIIAVGIEKYQNIFATSEDIKDDIPLKLLGKIPLDENLQKNLQDTNRYDNPWLLKSFESVYANIRFIFSEQPIRSLAVGSASPGDGKSTFALYLAQTAAAIGQRVLLVDTNFRQPQVHVMLDLPNSKGLSDLLSQKQTPTDVIVRSPLSEHLFVLTSGQPLPNSSNLLASAQMQYLMKNFQATFDLVIYDTPHLADLMDAYFLAASTDGMLMVVGLGKTKRSVVTDVINQLNAFNLPILGVVANYVKQSPQDSSRR